jgi:phosphate transport system permease protein
MEAGGSAVASLAFIWIVFTVAGVSAPFGMLVCWFLTFMTIYGVLCWRQHGVLLMKDRLATVAIWAGALAALIPLVDLIIFVILKGAPVAFAAFPHFFIADMSKFQATSPVTDAGAGAAIVGTIEQVGLATLATVPLGVMAATYLVYNRNLFSRLSAMVVDAMTGAPAIILGLFIYLLWVAPRHHSGKSGFAAAMALAVMMLPLVTRTAQEAIVVVPGSLQEAALALGAPQWRMTLRVILPTARVGLITAVILGIARIAGETAPILFNAGGLTSFNWNPFSGQQDDLPFRIYEMIFQPGVNAIRVAWGVSFVLVLVILILFLTARMVGASKPGSRLIPLPIRRRSTSAEVPS